MALAVAYDHCGLLCLLISNHDVPASDCLPVREIHKIMRDDLSTVAEQIDACWTRSMRVYHHSGKDMGTNRLSLWNIILKLHIEASLFRTTKK